VKGVEEIMFRHPRYLEIPWELHWDKRDKKKDGGTHHHPLLRLIVILLAMLLIGIGVTSGLYVGPRGY